MKLDFSREANSTTTPLDLQGNSVKLLVFVKLLQEWIWVPESFMVSFHILKKKKKKCKAAFSLYLTPRETGFCSRCNWRRMDGCRGGLWFLIPFHPLSPQKRQSVGSPKLIQQDLRDQFWGGGVQPLFI